MENTILEKALAHKNGVCLLFYNLILNMHEASKYAGNKASSMERSDSHSATLFK